MRVLEAGRSLGVPVGKHCFGAQEVRLRIKQGWQFLALASDVRFMQAAAQAALGAVQRGAEPEERASTDLY